MTRGLPEGAGLSTSTRVTGQCSSEIHYLETYFGIVGLAGTFLSQMTANAGSFSDHRCKAQFWSYGLNRGEKIPPATSSC